MLMNERRLSTWARSARPASQGTLFRSQRGRTITTRLVTLGDTVLLADLLSNLSARSLFLRYCTPMPRMAPEAVEREAVRMGEVDPGRRLAAVALVRTRGVEQAIGVAELVRDGSSPGVAELAVVIADAYQREGIGGALCAYLGAAGLRHGITTMRAMALAENTAVRRMISRSGMPYTAETRFGMTTIEIDLQARQ